MAKDLRGIEIEQGDIVAFTYKPYGHRYDLGVGRVLHTSDRMVTVAHPQGVMVQERRVSGYKCVVCRLPELDYLPSGLPDETKRNYNITTEG